MSEDEDRPLTEEETRNLDALKLFYEALGRDDIAKKLDDAKPTFQRLSITMYQQWLDHPVSFGAVWKWLLKFLPVTRLYVWLKERLTKANPQEK